VSPTDRQPAARHRTPAFLLLALLAAAVAVTGCASRKARDTRSGADLVYEAAA
jgi:hypothetical protein